MMEEWRESSDHIHLRIWDVVLVTDVHEGMMYHMDEHVLRMSHVVQRQKNQSVLIENGLKVEIHQHIQNQIKVSV